MSLKQEKYIRAFVAVPIDLNLRIVIQRTQSLLGVHAREFRWTDPAQVHLTLVFLGDTSERDLIALKSQLQSEIADIPSFDLRIDRFGAFPKMHRPRVLWIGFREVPSELRRLQEGIATSSRKIGIDVETRDFHPHLTLARLRNRDTRVDLSQGLDETAIDDSLTFTVRECVLFESVLRPSGPVYSRLASFSLV